MKEEKQIVTPYDDDLQGKKGQVTRMFDKIAPYYDFGNRFLSLGIDTIWRSQAIKTIKPYQPKVILDIATGTADLAIEAFQKLKPDQVIGVDISKEMIRIGDKKLEKKNLDDNIKLELGDSESLRFDQNSFDVVTAAFGVRNFENLEKGLQEMHRVLKPGGACMILEFSKPRAFGLKHAFNLYFKYILPVIGKLGSKDPKAYDYLYKSVQAFPDYENFASILKGVGFSKVSFKPLSFGICTIYLAEK